MAIYLIIISIILSYIDSIFVPDLNLKTIGRDICLSITNSLLTLNNSIILLKLEQDWENLKIGTGPQPIKQERDGS